MEKNSAITKNQLCWVIIRTMGVITLFMTLSRVYQFLILLSADKPRHMPVPNDAYFYIIVEALTLLALTYYLTQEGSGLHQILTNEEPADKAKATTLYK